MLLPRLAFVSAVGLASVLSIGACGPDGDRECTAETTNLANDPLNCGSCDNACATGSACIDGRCLEGLCQPGVVEDCYTGTEDTLGIGPCVGGQRVCGETGAWGSCAGQVIPGQENCGDGVDNNCNGMVDENIDADGDGFTTCGVPGLIPGDCCDSTECGDPRLVNAGAFDAVGNGIDDDCNGVVDDTILLCDQNLDSNTTDAYQFAKALDLCQRATEQDANWGVIEAKITQPDGTGVPDKDGYSIRSRFGMGVIPQGGVSLAIISSGGAAAKGDVNPAYHPWVSYARGSSAGFPADWYAANGNSLPNAPGCPAPSGSLANDAVMITLRVRVPTNARSFKLSSNFFSAEFPEYTCTQFNDFFVVLLDSTYDDEPKNPLDKNLAFFQPMGTTDKVPVGVNLAYGDTGLFTQCVNGQTGCSGSIHGTINTCTSVAQLAGTGFDDPRSGSCDSSSLNGGGTGWLVTSGNVTPGEIMTLRIAIWDTSDWSWDSAAVIDGFAWSTEVANPGTVIF